MSSKWKNTNKSSKQTTPDGYLINLSDNSTFWWHLTNNPNVSFDSDGFPYTWFAAEEDTKWDTADQEDKDYVVKVQIKIPEGCGIFDVRSLFPEIPKSVQDRLFDDMEDEMIYSRTVEDWINYEEGLDESVIEYFGSMHISSKPLSMFRSRSGVGALIDLWLFEYSRVQDFLSEYGSELNAPISGWFEVERVNHRGGINVGLFMDSGDEWEIKYNEIKCIRPKVTVISVEKNRYNPASAQTTPEGYLINPSDNSTFWWHVTDDPNISFDSDDHTYTWFAGAEDTFWDTGDLEMREYIAKVQIKLPEGCEIFDPRNLFPQIPESIQEELNEALSDACSHCISDIAEYEVEDCDLTTVIDYFESVSLESEILESYRERFGVESLIDLWALEYDTVQNFIRSFGYQLDTPISGWLEVERINQCHRDVNVGLIMNPRKSWLPQSKCARPEVTVVEVDKYYEAKLHGFRRNPFESCDHAMEELLAEFSEDLEFQKRRALSAVFDTMPRSPRSTPYFEGVIDDIKESQTLEELEDALSRNVRWYNAKDNAIKPIKFLAKNAEVVEDVAFIHYTDEESGLAINREGFKGRVTPRRQTLTREIMDSELLDDGYIFAYPLDQNFGVTIVDSDFAVIGEASFALAFNFVPDGGERQYIIPVQCIFDYEFVDLKNL